MNFVAKITIPVKIKAIPKSRYELNDCSIISLKKNPTNAAGIVAIIIYFHNVLASSLNVKRCLISFLVKIRTAIKEARCKAVKKNRFSGKDKIFETNARCPEEETGRNSVAA